MGNPPDPGKRRLLTKAAEWSAAAIIGKYAVGFFEKGGQAAFSQADQFVDQTIEAMIGPTVELPVWDGEELLVIECDFHHGPDGYLLTGRRLLRTYKNGASCAEAGKDMIEQGLMFMKAAKLRLRVDLKGVLGSR